MKRKRKKCKTYNDKIDERDGVELNVPEEHDANHVDDDYGDDQSDYKCCVQVE